LTTQVNKLQLYLLMLSQL